MKREKKYFLIVIFFAFIIFLAISLINAKLVNENSVKDRNNDGVIDVRDLIHEYNPRIIRGDANQDGKVDVLDLVILGKSYGKSKSLLKAGIADGNNWDANAELVDFNKDGKVDILDLVILGKNYNTKTKSGEKGTTRVFFEPETSDVDKNQAFSVDAKIETDEEIAGFELVTSFDSSFVSVESVDEGDFLKKDGAGTITTGVQIDNTAGKIKFPVARISLIGVTGTGILAKINFKSKDKKGSSAIDLANTKIANPDAQYISGVQLGKGKIDIALHIPVIDSYSPLENPTITEEQQQVFSITDHDRANDIVSEKWFLDGNEVGNGKSYTYIAGYNSAVGSPHTVEFIVEDSEGNKAEKEWTLIVTNVPIPPTNPTLVELISNPDPAIRNSQLVFTCTASGSTHLGNAPVTYQYEFTKNGNVVQQYSNNNKLSCPNCIKHEKIQCNAKAVAEGLSSNPTSSSVIEIQNTPPTKPTNVKLEPANAYKNTKFTCTASGSTDADNDAIAYYYEFRKNGDMLQAYSTNAEYVCGNGCSKGDKIACYAKANDGEAELGEVKSNEVPIKNTPPTAPEIEIVPREPTTENKDNLLCTIKTQELDADGDAITHKFKWYKNDVAQDIEGDFVAFASDLLKKNDRWKCEVTPNDGEADGGKATDTVVIGGSRPSVTNLVLSPANPKTTDNLVASYDYFDADGDAEKGSEIKWYRNNEVQGEHNNKKQVPASATKKGEQWYFTVRPSDGVLFGELKTSNAVVIENTAPTLPTSVKLTPLDAYKNTKFTCTASGSIDADDDAIAYYYEFRKNGDVLQGYSENAEYTCGDGCNKHEVVSCYATAYDGEGSSEERKESNSVEIKNSAPVLQEIGNKEGIENKPLSFKVSATDADGDILTYTAENLPQRAEFVNNEFKWTPTLDQAGNYPVTFKVSDSEAEDSETINIVIADAKPDLFIKKLIIQYPKQPEANKDVIFAFVIKNQGTTGTENNVFWKIDTGDENSKTSTTPTEIGEGEEKTVFTKYKYATSEEYTIKVTVDPGNVIGELEEGNNEKTLNVIVK